LRIIDEVIDTT